MSTREEALEAMRLFIRLCAELGVVLAPDKLVYPTQVIEWLGIMLDSVSYTHLTLPTICSV